jgi:hypothetical protein
MIENDIIHNPIQFVGNFTKVPATAQVTSPYGRYNQGTLAIPPIISQ